MSRRVRQTPQEWRVADLYRYRLHCIAVAGTALLVPGDTPPAIIDSIRWAYAEYRRYAASQSLTGEPPPHPAWLRVYGQRRALPDLLVAEGVRSAPPGSAGDLVAQVERVGTVYERRV